MVIFLIDVEDILLKNCIGPMCPGDFSWQHKHRFANLWMRACEVGNANCPCYLITHDQV